MLSHSFINKCFKKNYKRVKKKLVNRVKVEFVMQANIALCLKKKYEREKLFMRGRRSTTERCIEIIMKEKKRLEKKKRDIQVSCSSGR